MNSRSRRTNQRDIEDPKAAWFGARAEAEGVATVRLSTGNIRKEVHWHEAHGIGRVKMKIKRFLD